MTYDLIVKLLKRLLFRFEEALDTRFQRTDERFDRLEELLKEVAADVAELDRFNRPYGDGTKIRRNRRWP